MSRAPQKKTVNRMKSVSDVVTEALNDDSVKGIRLGFSSQASDRLELKKTEFSIQVLNDGLLVTNLQKKMAAVYPIHSIQSIGIMK
jgi:hypothetical protein